MKGKKDEAGAAKRGSFSLGFGGIFKGLSDLVEKMGELAETGKEISGSGDLFGSDPGKGLKGVYGFSVKMGLGGEGVKVEPFGNIRKDESSGEAVVHEVREPMVDVFDEEDRVQVVAEMPGMGEKDVGIDLKDDILVLNAEKGETKFRKEVLLPAPFSGEDMTVSFNNGVVQILLRKRRKSS